MVTVRREDKYFGVLKLIDKLKNRFFFKTLYLIVRTGMGITFILSGIRKLPGIKFTILPPEDPVGAFFHAMHETGLFWNFIGYFQIVIGLMIFFNRTVVLSSLFMMPVTVNIFLVSIALNMKGTPIITSMMVLGNFYLIMWHYKNYLSILKKPFM